MRTAFALLVLALGTAPVLAVPAIAQDNADLSPSITRLQMTVAGTASQPADRAIISTGVSSTASTPSAASAANGRRMEQIMAAVRAAGIDASSIRTARVNLRPVYRTTPDGDDDLAGGVTGYAASNQITVEVNDLSRLSSALEAMINAGATSIEGPNFSVSDHVTLYDRARRDASAAALARAQIYADSFGLRVERIVNISDTPPGYGGAADIMVTARRTGGASVPTAVAEIVVNVSLSVEFALVPR